MRVQKEFERQCVDAVSRAVSEMGVDPGDLPVEVPDGADLAIPCFVLAKPLGMSPVRIAEEIARRISVPSGLISGLTPLNGYLNFTVDSAAIVADVIGEVTRRGADFGKSSATGLRMNVEHTSTNPTGPVHVGRARNPIIGDTLARCLRMRGHDVTTEYYINDVGKQVVTMTWGAKNVSESEAEAEREQSENPDYREKVDHRLVYNYRVATKRIHGNASLEGEIAEMVRRYEAGDEETRRAVRQVAEAMLGGINESLALINVRIDRYTWESDFILNGATKAIVDRLKGTGYSRRSEDGAWYLDLKGFGIHGKNTDFTFIRSDGTTLYTTRDLAYHEDKFSRSDRVIDVLGEDQKLGSKQLCCALEILGEEKRPEPLFYAFVSLPEGKMSTRMGTVVYLDDLVDESVARAYEEIRKRRADIPEGRMREIARVVGAGAVRYNIVRVHADKQIVFRWEDALNFDGNSGPYLQYTYARACSIIRKAGDFERDIDAAKLSDEYEVKLAKALAKFEAVLADIDATKRVNILPAYGHEVAAAFNQFYAEVPVLQASAEREARLTLVECARTVLGNVLGCLGMEAPEEM